MFCQACGLSQLSVVIDPGVLFTHYTYRSSINKGYVRHCRDMARSVKEHLQIGSGDLVVDVAGNDGALLIEFKEELGVNVVNVDPAEISQPLPSHVAHDDYQVLVTGSGTGNPRPARPSKTDYCNQCIRAC